MIKTINNDDNNDSNNSNDNSDNIDNNDNNNNNNNVIDLRLGDSRKYPCLYHGQLLVIPRPSAGVEHSPTDPQRQGPWHEPCLMFAQLSSCSIYMLYPLVIH